MKNRIGTLDGLRGIAILLVLAGHTASNFVPLESTPRRWLEAYANAGAGVRLFFVLSGYLITSLLVRELETTGTVSLSNFYFRRALRIFPAFFGYLLVLTVLALWYPTGITGGTFLTAASFTWNYHAFWLTSLPPGAWNLGHLWTLALEQQFYLAWPIVLLALGRRRALFLALALVVWCPLARVGSYYLFPAQRGYLGMMFHTGIDSLMAGCAAALVIASATARQALQRHQSTLVAVAAAWLLVASPLANLLIRGSSIAFGFTFDALAAAVLICWAHHAAPGIVTRALGRGIMPAIGIISYSLYLWQQPFLSPTGRLSRGDAVLPIAGAVMAAIASYFLVERPFLRLKQRARVVPPAPVLTA